MQYGQRYRILRVNGEVVEGKCIQTKGNDEQYPSFELGDGSLLGVHIDAVLGPVIDDCPVDGIERFDFVKPPSDELLRSIIRPELDTLVTAIYKDDPNGYVKYEISEG